MERVVALVEGHTETHFVQSTYGNSIVQRPFPNGDDVNLELIAESIIDHLETIGGSITKVMILLDREGRSETAAEIVQFLSERISPYATNRQLYIGVSDREIENWIIVDEVIIKSRFSEESYKYKFEGKNGKSTIKKLNGGRDLSYREKASLLKSSSPKRSIEKSKSLKAFLNRIDFEWEWASS